MRYSELYECPVKREEVLMIEFFRHHGLYMCHAYYKNYTERFDFYLTEKYEHLTKGQARKRLQELFPKAEIKKIIIPRNSRSCY